MRHLLTGTTAVLLLSAALGCHHTAGFCDCDPGWNACCPGSVGCHATHAEPIKAEPVKAMPKASDPGK